MNTNKLIQTYFNDFPSYQNFRNEIQAAVVSIYSALEAEQSFDFLTDNQSDRVCRQAERLERFADWARETDMILTINGYDTTREYIADHQTDVDERAERILSMFLAMDNFIDDATPFHDLIWDLQCHDLIWDLQDEDEYDMLAIRRHLRNVCVMMWDDCGMKGLDKRADRKHQELAKLTPETIESIRSLTIERFRLEKVLKQYGAA